MNRVVVQDVENGPLRMHIGSGIPQAFGIYQPPSEEFYNNASLLFVVDGVVYVDQQLKQEYDLALAAIEEAKIDEQETSSLMENRKVALRAAWKDWDNLTNANKMQLLKKVVGLLLRERED